MPIIRCILITLALFSIAAPASGSEPDPVDLKALKDLSSVELAETLETEAQRLRPEAIREAGQVLGTQTAVRYRYAQIIAELRTHEASLDKIFNFTPLMMHKGRVVPPVIVASGHSLRIETPDQGSFTGASFRILKPAQLVSLAPDWRSYLLTASLPAVQPVEPSLLPKNSAERLLWEAAVEEGWKLGLQHAENLFEVSLARLVRDIRGMIRFKALVAQGMVSLPQYAEGHLGIQVGADSLDVDQRVFRLILPSRFMDVDNWKPVLKRVEK